MGKHPYRAPKLKMVVLRPEEASFVNYYAMNDEDRREFDAALATAETWSAYCTKLGVSVHSPRPTQPWDSPSAVSVPP